jgi:TrmH family RNA methyltransferase
MNKRISSSDNKEIKHLIKLVNKPRLRKESKSFVVEGKRELEMAYSTGYLIKKIYCNPNIIDPKTVKSHYDTEIIEVNNDIYSKISFRSSTEGMVAIVFQKDKNFKLDDDKINLALVLDGIEKPGNIGAILRSCDSADVDLIILNNEKCDLYNPNLIRSSLGSIFSQKIMSMKTDDTLDFLKDNKFRIYATSLSSKNNIDKIKFGNSSAIVLGSESSGISKFWLDKSDEFIKIPMLGLVDSLNVSVSAAITLYEVNRQNNFKR